MAEKPIYTRMRGESEKAWEAFRIYRDMGLQRSVTAVTKQLQKSMTLVDRWARKYAWSDRALEWDTHLDEVARQQAEQDRRDMADRHIKLASDMQGIGVAKLNEWQKQIELWKQDPTQPLPNISPSDISKLIEIGVKIERLSRGEPTEQIDSRVIEYKFIAPRKTRAKPKKVSPVTDGEIKIIDRMLSNANNK